MVASLDRKCLGGKTERRRKVRSEAFSIRRQEGSRWRLRRTRLWRFKVLLVPSHVPITDAGICSTPRRQHFRPLRWRNRQSFGNAEKDCAGRRTHLRVGVLVRRLPRVPAVHELSKDAHRGRNSDALSFCTSTMADPHRGQCQVSNAAVGDMASGDETGTASSVRQSESRELRHRLARNPKCRMRTKPFGNT